MWNGWLRACMFQFIMRLTKPLLLLIGSGRLEVVSCKILQEEEMGCNSRLHRVGVGKLYGGKSLLLSVRLVGRLTHGICCPPIPPTTPGYCNIMRSTSPLVLLPSLVHAWTDTSSVSLPHTHVLFSISTLKTLIPTLDYPPPSSCDS